MIWYVLSDYMCTACRTMLSQLLGTLAHASVSAMAHGPWHRSASYATNAILFPRTNCDCCSAHSTCASHMPGLCWCLPCHVYGLEPPHQFRLGDAATGPWAQLSSGLVQHVTWLPLSSVGTPMQMGRREPLCIASLYLLLELNGTPWEVPCVPHVNLM